MPGLETDGHFYFNYINNDSFIGGLRTGSKTLNTLYAGINKAG
jgi:hypothetical protein